MRSTRRYLGYFLFFVGLSVAFSGCDCSDDIKDTPGAADCVSSAECDGDQECIDGSCRDMGPDAGIDAGDTGGEPDADTGEDPDCPDPITCEEQDAECGWIPDGCGGSRHCGNCEDGRACGAGEQAGECIDLQCTPGATCEDAGAECGAIPDGCGATINCGSCDADQVCGSGLSAGQCIDEDCTPLGCTDFSPGECGPHPDGCGGVIQCGSCGPDQTCGTGSELGECLDISCTPLTCSDYSPGECGPHPDGCGGTIDCGLCSGGDVCGTGSQMGECVTPTCTPLTCADYDDVNCGPVSDGCGGMTADCGSCQDPEICGGGGLPNVCGAAPQDGCDGLCQDQAICSDGDATTLEGTVYAPNGTLPIPNAVVYVPNVPIADLPDVSTGAVCQQCEDEDLGDPLVGTVTDYDGTFELRHVPAGVDFPLVIKIGQWRRVVTISAQTACETSTLSSADTRLPTSQEEDSVHDNIPHIAITTGAVDAMECVFLKLGVDDTEFTRNYENGRIHMYRANGGVVDQTLSDACSVSTGWWTTVCGQNTCTDRDPGSCGTDNDGLMLQDNLSHNLYQDQAALDSYDMVVMGCEANEHTASRTTADKNRIRDYVNAGGRLFASHYAYDWLHQTDELEDTAIWGGGEDFNDTSLAFVDDTFAGGVIFWDWLQLVDADYDTTGPNGEPQIEISDPRTYVIDVVDSLSTRWVYTDASAPGHNNRDSIQQYTFDTPVYDDPSDQCGRVAYSAFHVDGVLTSGGSAFPSYCDGNDLSPQEKVLAFMLFDLASCVTEDGEPPPPECEPMTCADTTAECGVMSDGCGGVTDNCGDCPDGTSCGAGGVANMCGGACTPLTCDDHGADCGIVDDGCGGTVDCGVCPDGSDCGAGGTPNTCGCEPMTCSDHGADCGTVDDGCGDTIDCGVCPDGEQCGSGGQANSCGGDCVSLTCDDHGAECGTVDDGCGNSLDCGDCPSPQSCGGGGEAYTCGCSPLTCDDHNAECGTVADGCGNTLSCGDCPDDEICSEDLECMTPPCRNDGETCDSTDQCCSGNCAIPSGADEGECISG